MTALTIAVVSYNTRDLTVRCLQAAERAAAGRDAALVLVDNGSRDGTVDAVTRACPRWQVVVLPENPGYGAALNRAFTASPARHHLALNADVLVDADGLAALVEFLERTPRCGLVGPTLAYPDGRPQPSAKRFPGLGFAIGETLGVHALLPRSRWVRRFYYAERTFAAPATVETVSGAAMLIRGDAFRAVGGFDEGFWMYFEETDLCRRLAAAGFDVVFFPGARAVHAHGASSKQTTVRLVDYYVSYVRYFAKHRGRLAARLLAGVVALSTALRMLALVVKYPPLGRRREMLVPRLAACRRLLAALTAPPVRGASSVRP